MIGLLLALAAPALAAPPAANPCDPKALTKEIEATSPVALPALYQRMGTCDAKVVQSLTPKVFERLLAGDDGNAAALQAVQRGLGGDVRAWLKKLEPDQRSATVAFLGSKCASEPSVQGFFQAMHKELGATFFAERLHRGLVDCRVPEIQQILTDAVSNTELARDRARFFSIVEVYARNLGPQALPKLTELATQFSDEEGRTYLISAFADTAGVGSPTGVNAAAAQKAVDAIVALGPTLPPRAVDQARTILRTLGDEAASDGAAAWRWPDRKDGNGNYRYAVSVLEKVTCGNGKTLANLHLAPFSEKGQQWPDQLQPLLLDKLRLEWVLTAADKCKGTPTFTVTMPDAPFTKEEEQLRWIEQAAEAGPTVAGAVGKFKVIRREPFTW